jgi:hypothetical protein
MVGTQTRRTQAEPRRQSGGALPDAPAVVLIGLLRGAAAVMLTDAEVRGSEEERQTRHNSITAALAPANSAKDRSRPAKGRRPAARGS